MLFQKPPASGPRLACLPTQSPNPQHGRTIHPPMEYLWNEWPNASMDPWVKATPRAHHHIMPILSPRRICVPRRTNPTSNLTASMPPMRRACLAFRHSNHKHKSFPNPARLATRSCSGTLRSSTASADARLLLPSCALSLAPKN